MSTLTACYVPNFETEGMFLRHLAQNQPASPFVFFTDGPAGHDPQLITTAGCEYIKPLPAAPDNDARNRSRWYGIWSVVRILEYCRAFGYEHVLLCETDCRFNGVGWNASLIDEFEPHKRTAVCGGTPVLWQPWGRDYDWVKASLNYVCQYNQRGYVPMAIEGYAGTRNTWTALYPNGALGVYRVDSLWGALNHFAHLPYTSPAQHDEFHRLVAYDMAYGRFLVENYGQRALEVVVPLFRSLSCCGEHRVTIAERLALLQKGYVLAIHDVKDQAKAGLKFVC